jgi:predicted component of type VI protein secretion system
MSANKPAWTSPGPSDEAAEQAAEQRKGTAAEHPVLSLAPAPSPHSRRARAVAAATSPSAALSAAAAARDGGTGTSPDHRSPAEIEADIEEARVRLATTLDELTERLSPRAVLRRANTSAKSVIVTPQGGVRKDRAAIAAGVVLVTVGGFLAVHRLRRG